MGLFQQLCVLILNCALALAKHTYIHTCVLDAHTYAHKYTHTYIYIYVSWLCADIGGCIYSPTTDRGFAYWVWDSNPGSHAKQLWPAAGWLAALRTQPFGMLQNSTPNGQVIRAHTQYMHAYTLTHMHSSSILMTGIYKGWSKSQHIITDTL